MNMIKYVFLMASMLFLMAGCASKTLVKSQAISFTAISPIIKISDLGFLRVAPNSTKLQIYSSGVSLLEISISDRICMNGACKDELKFNDEFFGQAHYKGFLNSILQAQPIYNSRNLVKTNCGFEQNLSHLTYKICDNETFYEDSKNHVKIVVRKLD